MDELKKEIRFSNLLEKNPIITIYQIPKYLKFRHQVINTIAGLFTIIFPIICFGKQGILIKIIGFLYLRYTFEFISR